MQVFDLFVFLYTPIVGTALTSDTDLRDTKIEEDCGQLNYNNPGFDSDPWFDKLVTENLLVLPTYRPERNLAYVVHPYFPNRASVYGKIGRHNERQPSVNSVFEKTVDY
ncbi:hypothetical protein K458DRAFT_407579 [Lentithecium fluviatile CBS 122367]|uniref:Uncharacterized protein n=1 Tax=Lentithecium fluviatile CBS 122367 TaxID=1168545 RepID=A0A6G1IPC2_9PLEO|nr:hypothetical protein K458DRAFT_407579 [Lentithecium fluviatile CBS 122367]